MTYDRVLYARWNHRQRNARREYDAHPFSTYGHCNVCGTSLYEWRRWCTDCMSNAPKETA